MSFETIKKDQLLSEKMPEPICTRCIYDSSVPGVSFDDEGVCNYCRQVEELSEHYGTGTQKGIDTFNEILENIKKNGKSKKYDCIVGVSGGTDSSYLLLKSIEWGLRPLAVHFDNTWNTATATENIRKVTGKLKVDLSTYVISNREADDLYRAFFLAGVPELESHTDLAFAQVLRMTAAKHGIKYILEGHSFQAEGISPMRNNYFDGQYVKSVHKAYGRIKLKTYPMMDFYQFMKWVLVYRQQFVRPLWYLNYTKAEAREILQRETGWEYYGGHHLENISARYVHQIYHPQKFGMDNRNWSLAAAVRSGAMDRDEAIAEYISDLEPDPKLEAYWMKRLNLTESEYRQIMVGPKKSFRDFKTYKQRFERLRPFFKILADKNLVPRSFYVKYCFPMPADPS